MDIIESELIRTISPDEDMFAGSEEHYFGVGRSALECIDVSLRAAGRVVSDVKRVLDLPCGHGRVTRYLRLAFPEAGITACDLLRDGVDFCASTFGAVPIYSADEPNEIPLERDAFDLIWVGSLFTHFDSGLWSDFLKVFRSWLRPGGVLVFTTQGRKAYRNVVNGSSIYGLLPWRRTTILYNYERRGFGFERYQSAVSTKSSGGAKQSLYGMSLSSPDWVIAQIAKLDGLRVVHFSERAWDNHQDCFACVRDDPDEQVILPNIKFHRYVKDELMDVKWAIRERFPGLLRLRERFRRR